LFNDPTGLRPPKFVPPVIGDSAVQQNVKVAEGISSPTRFRDLVRGNAAWDYKQYDSRYEDFGNYNFGATAAATGMFDLNTVLRQAGRAQCVAGTSNPAWKDPESGAPYGDDPNDQYWIKQGWNDYMVGMYGTPRKPRLGGLIPFSTRFYSDHFQKPLPYCSGSHQCW